MHDDDVRNPRRIGLRVSFSAGKTKVKRCVVLRRRRVLVLWLVALVMAFKNVRNLLLINHNDGFIDDDEFVVLYDLYAAKNLDFPYAGTFWPGKAWWVWPGFTCCQKNTKIYVFFSIKTEDLYLEEQLKISTMICRSKIRRTWFQISQNSPKKRYRKSYISFELVLAQL